MKELFRVRVQYASRHQCCKKHKRPLPFTFTSVSDNVLGGASQAMDSGVYLVLCVRCPTEPNCGVLVGNAGFRDVFIMR